MKILKPEELSKFSRHQLISRLIYVEFAMCFFSPEAVEKILSKYYLTKKLSADALNFIPDNDLKCIILDLEKIYYSLSNDEQKYIENY